MENFAHSYYVDEDVARESLDKAGWNQENAGIDICTQHTFNLYGRFSDIDKDEIDEILMKEGGHVGRANTKLSQIQQERANNTCTLCENEYDSRTRPKRVYCTTCKFECCSVCRIQSLQQQRNNLLEGYYSEPKCHQCKTKLRYQWRCFPELFFGVGGVDGCFLKCTSSWNL